MSRLVPSVVSRVVVYKQSLLFFTRNKKNTNALCTSLQHYIKVTSLQAESYTTNMLDFDV